VEIEFVFDIEEWRESATLIICWLFAREIRTPKVEMIPRQIPPEPEESNSHDVGDNISSEPDDPTDSNDILSLKRFCDFFKPIRFSDTITIDAGDHLMSREFKSAYPRIDRTTLLGYEFFDPDIRESFRDTDRIVRAIMGNKEYLIRHNRLPPNRFQTFRDMKGFVVSDDEDGSLHMR